MVPTTRPLSPLVRRRERACERCTELDKSDASAVGMELMAVDPMAMGSRAVSSSGKLLAKGSATAERRKKKTTLKLAH